MLTAIYVYSMNIEYFGSSKYTSLSVPIRGSWFLLGKFFVIIIVGFCINFLHFTLAFLPWGTLTKAVLINVFKYSEFILRHSDPGILSSLHIEIIDLIFCLGLASFAQGAICMVKKYRFLLWSGIFLVVNITYVNSWIYFLSSHNQHNEVIQNIFIFSCSPPMAGLIFLAIGLILFEKYAEV